MDRSSLADEDLDTHIDDVVALARRGVEVHTLTHGALAPILFEFATTCEELLGWDMASSLEMVSGTSFKSTGPSRGLSKLALMAKARPEVLEFASIPEDVLISRLRQTQ